jgi:hypothetical protein
MTTAGLSMRRPRSWTRSDPEGDRPGARRQAGSRRRAVGWIQNVRHQAEEPRRSDGGGERKVEEGAETAAQWEIVERGLSGSGTKEEAVYMSTSARERRRGRRCGEKPRRGRQARGARHATSPR